MCDLDGMILEELTPATVDLALDLCNRYVGDNLYSRKEFEEAIQSDDHFFFLLFDKDRNPIGYTYFLLMDAAAFLDFSKLTPAQLAAVGLAPDARIGNLRSLSVVEAYRGKHYATYLFDLSLRTLAEHTNAAIAAGVLWRMGNSIPMKKTFENFAFTHLADTERVWYDREDMVCPYCQGRCVCGASVYYKRLEES